MSKALVHVEHEALAVQAPGAKEAKTLGQLYEAAQHGMRRVVALGLFAHEIKSRLKHGQFGPWLKEHAPELSREVDGRPLAATQLSAYMQLASGVLESAGFKLQEFIEVTKIRTSDLSHGGEILTLPEAKVPEEVKPMRDKICALIDGKTQRQLFAEFKTAEDGDDDDLKVGSPLGKHHPRKAKPPTAEEQLKAQMQHEEELIDIVIADMRLAINSLLRTARPKALQDGLNAGTEWNTLLRQLLKAEKQARKRKSKPAPLLNAQPK